MLRLTSKESRLKLVSIEDSDAHARGHNEASIVLVKVARVDLLFFVVLHDLFL